MHVKVKTTKKIKGQRIMARLTYASVSEKFDAQGLKLRAYERVTKKQPNKYFARVESAPLGMQEFRILKDAIQWLDTYVAEKEANLQAEIEAIAATVEEVEIDTPQVSELVETELTNTEQYHANLKEQYPVINSEDKILYTDEYNFDGSTDQYLIIVIENEIRDTREGGQRYCAYVMVNEVYAWNTQWTNRDNIALGKAHEWAATDAGRFVWIETASEEIEKIDTSTEDNNIEALLNLNTEEEKITHAFTPVNEINPALPIININPPEVKENDPTQAFIQRDGTPAFSTFAVAYNLTQDVIRAFKNLRFSHAVSIWSEIPEFWLTEAKMSLLVIREEVHKRCHSFKQMFQATKLLNKLTR